MVSPTFCPDCRLRNVGGAKPWEVDIAISSNYNPTETFSRPLLVILDSTSTWRTFDLSPDPANPLTWAPGESFTDQFVLSGVVPPLSHAHLVVLHAGPDGSETVELNSLTIE